MLRIGLARIDITPEVGGWMDGMPRAHGSTSIHDPLSARAVVFDDGASRAVVVSCEIADLTIETSGQIRKQAAEKIGIAYDNIFLVCTHTHSGPATLGFCNPPDEKYLAELPGKLLKVIEQAAERLVPVRVGIGKGKEETISYYRRLRTKNGKIVMNWEDVDPDSIVGPAGEPDHEVGVIKFVSAQNEREVLATIFHYTAHPNVLSGESFMISAEFPGLAARIIEEKLGGLALFINGAQGSSDIDGLKDRNWEGVERTGRALAEAVLETAKTITICSDDVKLAGGLRKVEVPYRNVCDEEIAWARKILAESSGQRITLADGVPDDFIAETIMELLPKRGQKLSLELGGLAIGEMAFVCFPGELFTEIGLAIKKRSPFKQTYIMGLTNGRHGYFPTSKAVAEGGYAVDTRRVDPPAEEIITEASVELLKEMAGKVR